MKRAFLIVVGVVAGFATTSWFKGRAVAQLRAQVAELEKRPASCPPAFGWAQLSSALAALKPSRAVPRRPLPPTVSGREEMVDGKAFGVDDQAQNLQFATNERADFMTIA